MKGNFCQLLVETEKMKVSFCNSARVPNRHLLIFRSSPVITFVTFLFLQKIGFIIDHKAWGSKRVSGQTTSFKKGLNFSEPNLFMKIILIFYMFKCKVFAELKGSTNTIQYIFHSMVN